MNTFAKHHPRAKAHEATAVPLHTPGVANVAPQAVPLAWWQHSLQQQLAAQQSLWDTWTVWAWIPWNLSLSAWQMAEMQTPTIASAAPSGMLFSMLGGNPPSMTSAPPQAAASSPP